MEVFIESSKTDQFRDGAWVPIARINSNICPVTMLECYLQLADIQGNSPRAEGTSAAANAGIPDHWFKRHGRMQRTATSKIGLKTDSA